MAVRSQARQEELVLAAIREGWRTLGYPPQLRMLAQLAGLSVSTVVHTVARLEAAGLIYRVGGKRQIMLTGGQDTIDLVAASLRRRGFWIVDPQLTRGWAYVKACKANGEEGGELDRHMRRYIEEHHQLDDAFFADPKAQEEAADMLITRIHELLTIFEDPVALRQAVLAKMAKDEATRGYQHRG